jgi:RNA polymerase sigma factor (sigma-70 family)
MNAARAAVAGWRPYTDYTNGGTESMTRAAHVTFEQLYGSDFNRLARRYGRTLGSAADGEEVAGRAFIDLWAAINRQLVTDQRALLFTIADRRATDVLRERYQSGLPRGLEPWELEGGEELPPVWAIIPPEDFDTVEFQTTFDAGLRSLPKDERDTFILTELRGASTAETAHLTDASVRTVERRRAAARTFIAKELHS